MKAEAAINGKTNTRRTVLDEIEFGSDEFLERELERDVKAVVPDGVHKRAVYADIIALALPTFVELTLASLAGMVDMMMVGNIGPEAISAVSIATQPKFILNTAFMAMCTGTTALVARCRGAGEQDRANHFLRQSLLITFVLSMVSMVIGLVFTRPLILLMGKADEAVVQGGCDYLRWQLYTIVPMSLTFTVTSALRGVGKNRVSMVYNVISNVVNVIMNYLLIEGHCGFPRLEVIGASIATSAGQMVAFVIALCIILNPKQYLHVKIGDSFKPDFSSIKEISKIGLPAMFEQVMMRIGMIIYTRQVVSLGTIPYATHNVCMNINSMSFMTGNAFANAATALMGQSLGRRRPDMGVVYVKFTKLCGFVIAIILCLCFVFFGGTIVSWYNESPEIIQTGAVIMYFIAFMQPFQNAQFITAGALRGAGDTKSIAKIIMLTTVIIRAGMAILFIRWLKLGLYGAWGSLVFDQLLRTLLITLRYRSGKWKHIRVKIK